jgi:hypothetical protein
LTIVATAAHAAFVAVERERGESVDGIRGFTADELRRLIEVEGFTVTRAGGLGSLAWLCGREHVRAIAEDPSTFAAFVERCEAFDRDLMPDGPGTEDDTGLIGVGRRTRSY